MLRDVTNLNIKMNSLKIVLTSGGGVKYIEDYAGHDRRYAIYATKLENEPKWKAEESFDTGIIKTIEWYLDKYLGSK